MPETSNTNTKQPEKVDAFFVVWECHCSDVRIEETEIPVQCPGHGRGQIAKPEQLAALTSFVGVHECGDGNRCPEAVTR